MSGVPKIVLLGVSGSGKTSVGKILAQRCDLAFLDADDLVAQQSGVSLADLIIAQDPQLEHRRRSAALRALASSGTIVALGASQIEDIEILHALHLAKKRGSFLVELLADTAEVVRRMGLNRPRSVGLGAPRAVLSTMIAALHERYADVVDSSVQTEGMTPALVADRVLEECRIAGGFFEHTRLRCTCGNDE